MATVFREGGGEVVAYEEFGTVDGLDVAVKFGVAGDDACKVSHFVQDAGEQVVFAVCVACGGAECCVGEGLREFSVVEWGGVDEPADSVSISVDEDCATVGATEGVKLGDLGFG